MYIHIYSTKDLTRIPYMNIHEYSQQHYLWQSKIGNNPNVHNKQTNMTNCVIFIQQNIKQLWKWINYCHDNNMEEFSKYNVEWKTSDKREDVLYDSFYIKLKTDRDGHRSQDITYLWERRVITGKEHKKCLWVLVIFCFMVWGVATQVIYFIKNYQA